MELKEKINNIKRKTFIESKKEFYKAIFGGGFLDMVLMEDYINPEINTVISFIENPKISKKNYRVMPTMTISSKENVVVNRSIADFVNDFFENDVVSYLFSHIYNTDHEISGYISLKKKSFVENFNKLLSTYGFITNEDNTKFIYYCASKSSEKIYFYKGLIKEDKFIKILN